MKLNRIHGGRVVAVVAGATVIATLSATAGFAANEWGSANIRDNSLRGVDIRDGSLGPVEFSETAKNRLKGDRGAQGDRGPRGLPGQRGQQGVPGNTSIQQVTDLDGDFTARAGDEAGVAMTGDGVQFGPFENNSQCTTPGVDYARLNFSGLNGEPLSSLSSLSYRAQHVADGDTEGYGAIPIRVFYDNPGTADDDRFTFSPNTQFNETANYGVSQGTVNEYLVTSGTARVNDDGGSNPAGERLVSGIIEEFGDMEITKIDFLGGCSGAPQPDLRQIVTEVQVNGTTYDFGG